MSAVFESDPLYSIEAQSYCTIGQIEFEKLHQFFGKFPEIKEEMINEVISNPFDSEREHFLSICKNKIPFFLNLPDNLIRQVFYQCQHRFIYPDELLFDVGEPCQAIYFILEGQIDIELCDGESIHTLMDTLGPGSIAGMNFMLK